MSSVTCEGSIGGGGVTQGVGVTVGHGVTVGVTVGVDTTVIVKFSATSSPSHISHFTVYMFSSVGADPISVLTIILAVYTWFG